MSEEYIVDADHVTIRFNLASEKVDNLKEYVIRLLEAPADVPGISCSKGRFLKDPSGRSLGAHRHQRFRKIHALKAISGIMKPYKGTITVREVFLL